MVEEGLLFSHQLQLVRMDMWNKGLHRNTDRRKKLVKTVFRKSREDNLIWALMGLQFNHK